MRNLVLPSSFFPGILLFRKPSKSQGNSWFWKRTMLKRMDKESAPRRKFSRERVARQPQRSSAFGGVIVFAAESTNLPLRPSPVRCEFHFKRRAHWCPFWLFWSKKRRPWCTCWFNHLPGPSISPKRTPAKKRKNDIKSIRPLPRALLAGGLPSQMFGHPMMTSHRSQDPIASGPSFHMNLARIST